MVEEARSGPASIDREAIRAVLREAFDNMGVVAELPLGLRDRKKRLLRQLISDTATDLFLERGFHEVTVREVAEACDVSEKTVFNYFPTKESLLLDREGYQSAMIVEALRDRGPDVSLVDGILAVVDADLELNYERWFSQDKPAEAVDVMRRFHELIRETPSLAAAVNDMRDRLTQVAAGALAERAGVDPQDPEPQIAAVLVMGLWNVSFGALQRYSDEGITLDELQAAVMADVRRAARVADAGLSSFNLVVHRKARTREQLREAADATNEARKQVVAAVKKARDAWKVVVAEMKAQHEAGDEREKQRREERKAEMQKRRAELKERQAAARERRG